MITKKSLPFILSVRALACMIAFGSSPPVISGIYAQEQPNPHLPEAKVQHKEVMPSLDLEGEVTLKTRVSFEAKQRLLRDLLADLQQQSGVVLNLAPNPRFESVLVTAHIKELPLSKVMYSLGRLYGASWTKSADAQYQMDQYPSPIDANLASLGDLQFFRYWRESARRRVAPKDLDFEEPDDWTGEIFNDVPLSAIVTKGNIPLTALSADLQLRLRHKIEDEAAISLLRKLNRISVEQLKQSSLIVSIPKPKFPNSQSLATIKIQSWDGAIIAELFSIPIQENITK